MATTRGRTQPTLADIEAARERIGDIARVTPIYGSETLSRRAGREVLLKAENLQRTGAFKIRGAVNRIAHARRGSSAPPASSRPAPATTARRSRGRRARPASRRRSSCRWTRRWPRSRRRGTTAPRSCSPARRSTTRSPRRAAFVEQTGATFVHAFEDDGRHRRAGDARARARRAGARRAGRSSSRSAAAGSRRASRIALRALGRRAHRGRAAAAARRSRVHDSGVTIADGIDVKQPGELTHAILEELADDFVTVSRRGDQRGDRPPARADEAARRGGRRSVGVAALLAGRCGGNGTVVVVLSGGNIDPSLLITVMRHGLTSAGRYLVLRTRVPDRPGELVKLPAAPRGEERRERRRPSSTTARACPCRDRGDGGRAHGGAPRATRIHLLVRGSATAMVAARGYRV